MSSNNKGRSKDRPSPVANPINVQLAIAFLAWFFFTIA